LAYFIEIAAGERINTAVKLLTQPRKGQLGNSLGSLEVISAVIIEFYQHRHPSIAVSL
jgi:hypothetical protein